MTDIVFSAAISCATSAITAGDDASDGSAAMAALTSSLSSAMTTIDDAMLPAFNSGCNTDVDSDAIYATSDTPVNVVIADGGDTVTGIETYAMAPVVDDMIATDSVI